MHFRCLGFGSEYGPSNGKALYLEEWWWSDASLSPEINVKGAVDPCGDLFTWPYRTGSKSSTIEAHWTPKVDETSYDSVWTESIHLTEVTNRSVI